MQPCTEDSIHNNSKAIMNDKKNFDNIKQIDRENNEVKYGTKYSRTDQVKFVEDSLSKI